MLQEIDNETDNKNHWGEQGPEKKALIDQNVEGWGISEIKLVNTFCGCLIKIRYHNQIFWKDELNIEP